MFKKLLFLMIIGFALVGCNKYDSVTKEMLIGEWNCKPVEQRQSNTFDNNEFKDYKLVENIETKKIKYYEEGDYSLWAIIDNNAPIPVSIFELKPKQNFEFVTNDKKNKQVVNSEYNYISDDEFEEVVDIKVFPLVEGQIYFNLYTKSMCTRLTK